jgi:hypothetical protein
MSQYVVMDLSRRFAYNVTRCVDFLRERGNVLVLSVKEFDFVSVYSLPL